MKNNELLSLSFFLEEKNRLMSQVEQSMEEIRKKGYSNCREEIESMLQTILMSNNPEYDWDIFLKHFKEINKDFYHSLFHLNRNLSQNDLRHCVYIKMNLSTRQIARLLNVKTSSVQMARVRLKKKLKLSREQNLYDFIQSIG
jgi:DNA-binding MarR family transcriptional regulator